MASRIKRATIACSPCRDRKVRCNGQCPCSNCIRRSDECVFSEGRKIVLSEKYFFDLKRRAGEVCPNTSPPSEDAINPGGSQSILRSNTAVSEDVHPHSKLKNPLVEPQISIITDSRGGRHFLGASSTWAFGQHVLRLLQDFSLDRSPLEEVSPSFVDHDGSSHTAMSVGSLDTSTSNSTLPSYDYALYLTNTVKFHICSTYHLFDDKIFMQCLESLYADGPGPPDEDNRLWYVQYLVVMALGKALLTRNPAEPGSAVRNYLSQAIKLLPDIGGLYRDPILSIETCCGLALFLQSIDDRNSAFVYMGLALRIAWTIGLHRDVLGRVPQGNEFEVTRHRCAWWTIYVLEQKLSSLMGAPSILNDGDISVPMPQTRSLINLNALGLHIKLSRLIAKTLSTVYGIDGRLDSSFLQNVQVTLRELSGLRTELENTAKVQLESDSPISRLSATLNLCYHQCVIVATRPLLMCLLRDKLEKQSIEDNAGRNIAEPIKALLRTLHDSARASLQVLTDLQAQERLEKFLPFDLDHIFSSGSVLALISAIAPLPEATDAHLESTLQLLDDIANEGNLAAKFRREELRRLHTMQEQIIARGENSSQSQRFRETLAGTDTCLRDTGTTLGDSLFNVADYLESCPLMDMEFELGDTDWLWQDGLEGPEPI